MMQAFVDVIRSIIYIAKEILPMNEIAQFISTCGFPIACTCFLLWQSFRQDERTAKQYDDLKKAIDGNTRAVSALQKAVENLKR